MGSLTHAATRVSTVDQRSTTWAVTKIGDIGFPLLNLKFGPDFIKNLAKESCGSPQLMQSLCLQSCYRFDAYERFLQLKHINPTSYEIKKILEATASQGDFSTIVEDMHGGPKVRGQERKEYEFVDGSKGDVYRCVLLAISSDPPQMTLSYSELIDRVQKICINGSPVGSSVSEACVQIDKLASRSVQSESSSPGGKPIEWDTSSAVETINVAEPYFLFYLRASNQLGRLGTR